MAGKKLRETPQECANRLKRLGAKDFGKQPFNKTKEIIGFWQEYWKVHRQTLTAESVP